MTKQADVRLDECMDTAPAVPVRNVRWWGFASVVVALAVAVLLIVTSYGRSTPQDAAPAGTVTFPEQDRYHFLSKIEYAQSPPVGGNHSPARLNCGIYDLPVANESVVHSLEHGTVWITYLPSLSPAELDRLRGLVNASYRGPERYMILSPYPGQNGPIIATAWRHQLTLQTATDPRLPSFINYFRQGPQTLERTGRCSGGIGRPIG